jgi:LysM repeat protein
MPLIVTVTSPKEKKEKKTKNCQAVIYYANENESTWDIAKNHNSNIEELKCLNEIDDDTIKENKALIIPIY